MEPSAHRRMDEAEISNDRLAGAAVYGQGGEKIGHIDHVHGSGRPAQAIIDIGGFLGIGVKPVLLRIADLDAMRDETGKMHAIIRWTKDQMNDLPEHGC